MVVGGKSAALSAGIGFPLADKLSSEQRRDAGIVLLLVGAISPFPWLSKYSARASSKATMTGQKRRKLWATKSSGVRT